MSKQADNPAKHKLQQYTLGFVMSVVLTILAYLFTIHHIFSGWSLAYVIVGLAVAQVIVQLVFFLHIGHESEPRWNLLALDFTLLIVVILVFGSLWIMNHLNYHMTSGTPGSNGANESEGMNGSGLSPSDTNNYIIKDEGFQRK